MNRFSKRFPKRKHIQFECKKMYSDRRNSTPSSSSSNKMINFDHHHHQNELLSLNRLYNSVNSDTTCSNYSSIESLLESRHTNPEEILSALGFGCSLSETMMDIDPLNRIPNRFFHQQSNAKGVDVNDILHMMIINNNKQLQLPSYYYQCKYYNKKQ